MNNLVEEIAGGGVGLDGAMKIMGLDEFSQFWMKTEQNTMTKQGKWKFVSW
jgi:hypothetical protein